LITELFTKKSGQKKQSKEHKKKREGGGKRGRGRAFLGMAPTHLLICKVLLPKGNSREGDRGRS